MSKTIPQTAVSATATPKTWFITGTSSGFGRALREPRPRDVDGHVAPHLGHGARIEPGPPQAGLHVVPVLWPHPALDDPTHRRVGQQPPQR